MNDRERRDFEAGLAAEVDAWLRGEPTRRDFIKRFGQMTGMLALSGGALAGADASWALAQAAVELADPSTPLGKAQAAAHEGLDRRARPTAPPTAPSQAAKQYSRRHAQHDLRGRPAGARPAQLLRPAVGAAHRHQVERRRAVESRTSIRRRSPSTSPAPAPTTSSTSAPAWTPSLADGGVIAPLDDYIAKYMNMADLDDYHPLYKALPTYKGKIWGFFDDGDMFALYYRKDIFEDPKLKEAYQAKFGKALEVPKTWEDYAQVAQFITDQMAPNVYGAGHFRKAGSPGNQFDFLQQFRANGGKFFDDDMKAQLASDAGVKTLDQHDRRERRLDPRQQRARRGVAVGRVAAGQGGHDLLLAADRTHDGRLLAERQGDQLRSAVDDRRQGRLCGRARAIRSTRPATTRRSPPIRPIRKRPTSSCSGPARRRCRWRAACCPMRCAIPTACRTSSRSSTAQLFPSAKDYLRNLNASANVGLLDPIMPGAQDYLLSLDRMCTVGLGRRRPDGGARRRRRRNGTRRPSASASIAEGVLRGVPEAAGRHRRQHGREARHGGEALD